METIPKPGDWGKDSWSRIQDILAQLKYISSVEVDLGSLDAEWDNQNSIEYMGEGQVGEVDVLVGDVDTVRIRLEHCVHREQIFVGDHGSLGYSSRSRGVGESHDSLSVQLR